MANLKRPPRIRRDPVRRVAYDVLRAVDERDAYANLLLPALLDERGITGRDAALATELTYGTLRGRGSYDAVLAACSDRPLARLDPPVREVLRLGTHQLLGTTIGSHAAVSTSVDLAKQVSSPGAAGFVNAVLRRVSSRDLDAWMSLLAPGDTLADLAVRYSYPEWIIGAFAAALGGDEELTDALAAGNERPAVTLAALPGVPLPADAEPARWSPAGFTMPGGDVRALTAGGRYAVQDEASQLAALALTRVPPDGADARWLDMCSGPGGKARLLHAAAAECGARLAAGELHEHRARLVREAISGAAVARSAVAGSSAGRAISGASVVVADGRQAPFAPGTFDRVLLDAPCTGLGALRRRPEARWRKTPADVPGLTGLQRGLLRSACEMVRPGGVVAYVTCSPVLAETSEVVRDVAAGCAEILDAPSALPEVPGLRAASDARFAQFWPHRHGTDAIFVALLRKQ